MGEKLARRIQRGLAEIQLGLEEALSHTQPEKSPCWCPPLSPVTG
ncbi:hypothetical protein [Aliamphritea spongicola]|nr:hypothetical protein [Aliamphritea spongicola]